MMKKLLAMLILLAIGIGAQAQKSYVTIYVNLNSYVATLSGNVPEGMQRSYSDYDFPEFHNRVALFWIGELLNQLAANGFQVEQMNTVNVNNNTHTIQTYLLSRTSNPSTPIAAVQRDKAEPEEVHEVARYNLQGLPVGKDEKGIQIVVYSNYTTRTIIVE